MSKSYSELIEIKNFEERLNYLGLKGFVGEDTFGGHRYLNQKIYQSPEWRRIRREVIIRDRGCDLAHELYPISGPIYIHHINALTIEDVLKGNFCIFDMENLVCTSFETHNIIHYGIRNYGQPYPKGYSERKRGDTCLWNRR